MSPGGRARGAARQAAYGPTHRGADVPVRNETQRQEHVDLHAEASAKVLVIAGRAQAGRQLLGALERRGYAATMASSAGDGLADLTRDPPHLVVVVLPLPDAGG